MNLQVSYNQVLSGELTKDLFVHEALRDVRFKNIISNLNSYDEMVSIFKSKGYITEATDVQEESFSFMSNVKKLTEAFTAEDKTKIDLAADHVNYYEYNNGWRFELRQKHPDLSTVTEEDIYAAKKIALKNVQNDPIYYTRCITKEPLQKDRPTEPIKIDGKDSFVDKKNALKSVKGAEKPKANTSTKSSDPKAKKNPEGVKQTSQPATKDTVLKKKLNEQSDIKIAHKLKGGAGDKLKVKDVDRKELKMGIKHEMEHTKDPSVAAEIAMDHLAEDPKYYTHLKAANIAEKAKPSSGLTKKEKSAVVKKAKAGKDIGKKGKGFEDVAKKAAKKYGSKESGEKVAAAAMWKNIKREGLNEGHMDDSDYKYYVVDKNQNKIISGWEYKDDAVDYKKDRLVDYPNAKLGLYSRQGIQSILKLNPSDDKSWGTDKVNEADAGKSIYSDTKGNKSADVKDLGYVNGKKMYKVTKTQDGKVIGTDKDVVEDEDEALVLAKDWLKESSEPKVSELKKKYASPENPAVISFTYKDTTKGDEVVQYEGRVKDIEKSVKNPGAYILKMDDGASIAVMNDKQGRPAVVYMPKGGKPPVKNPDVNTDDAKIFKDILGSTEDTDIKEQVIIDEDKVPSLKESIKQLIRKKLDEYAGPLNVGPKVKMKEIEHELRNMNWGVLQSQEQGDDYQKRINQERLDRIHQLVGEVGDEAVKVFNDQAPAEYKLKRNFKENNETHQEVNDWADMEPEDVADIVLGSDFHPDSIKRKAAALVLGHAIKDGNKDKKVIQAFHKLTDKK